MRNRRLSLAICLVAVLLIPLVFPIDLRDFSMGEGLRLRPTALERLYILKFVISALFAVSLLILLLCRWRTAGQRVFTILLCAGVIWLSLWSAGICMFSSCWFMDTETEWNGERLIAIRVDSPGDFWLNLYAYEDSWRMGDRALVHAWYKHGESPLTVDYAPEWWGIRPSAKEFPPIHAFGR